LDQPICVGVRPAELVTRLFSRRFRRFERAERFFCRSAATPPAPAAPRSGRFDMQRQIAERCVRRPAGVGGRTFMQFLFLNAKAVGDLTGLFLAQLDEQMGEGRRFARRLFRRRPKHPTASPRPRAAVDPDDHWLTDDPVRLVELFAPRPGGDGDPPSNARCARDARLVDGCARPRATPIPRGLTARDRPT
jgi:[protein-PII] uridylyltransferase